MADSIASPYGSFPSRYTCRRLGDVCEREAGIQTGPFGTQLHKEDYVAVGTPIITVEHLGENRIIHQDLPRVSDADRKRLSRYQLRQGDIVFSRVGSVDLRALVRPQEDGWLFSGRLLRVRCISDIVDSRYLSWFFGLPGFRSYVRRIAFGATMPSLNTKLLSDLPVYFPTLPEQQAIADLLDVLDERIDLNRCMNETLEAMARAIFKSWFIDFDAVRAKMEGRKPTGMSAEVARLFPDSFEDTTWGKVPKGWALKRLPDVVDFNPPRSLKKGVVAPYLDMKAMPTQGHYAAGAYPRTVGSGSRFKNGDTLVARITPCLENGKTSFVDFLSDGEVGWGSTEYIVMRPKSPIPEFWSYLLARDESFRQHAIQNMTGSSGRQRVPVGCFDGFLVPVPGEPVLRAFAEIVTPMAARIALSGKESETLAALRDTLLPKLLSGEIRVKNAGKKVTAAI